jgi:hypothetical protein
VTVLLGYERRPSHHRHSRRLCFAGLSYGCNSCDGCDGLLRLFSKRGWRWLERAGSASAGSRATAAARRTTGRRAGGACPHGGPSCLGSRMTRKWLPNYRPSGVFCGTHYAADGTLRARPQWPACYAESSMIPNSRARTTAWVRSETPSLAIMCST